MPLNRGAIIKVVELISIQKGLKCTVYEGIKGAATIGACAFGGALLGGRMGMAIGGALGSICTAVLSNGNFKSVASVISEEMTPQQRQQLENNLKAIFQDIDVTDITAAATMIMKSQSLQSLVLKELGMFLQKEMALQLMQ